MVNCGLYIRVSSEEQKTSGYSLGEQEERLKKYCEAMGWDVYKVYNDGGFSGANLNRPALQEMIKDIKRLDKVVVYKLDRLSRSQKDTLYLIEDIFLRNSCDFVSMSENFDTSTPFGKAMIGILAVFAQLEREQIKERMKMGKDARAKKGLFHGSRSPIGYDYKDGKLVINEAEAEQIRIIFEMYAQGKAPVTIANYLNENGYSHKYGEWKRKTIGEIIDRVTLAGMIPHNGAYYPGEHEAIISLDLFEQCQRSKKERGFQGEKYSRREGLGKSYLGGLMICGRCGGKYGKITKYFRGKHEKYQYLTYGCRRRCRPEGDERCDNKIWNMSELDNIIIDEIRKLRIEPTKQEAVRIPDKELEKLDKQLKKLLDLYSLGDMPVELLQDKIKEINEKKAKLEERIEVLKAENEKRLSLKQSAELIKDFSAILDSGNFEDIKAIIHALIEKIVLDGEDVTIFWNF